MSQDPELEKLLKRLQDHFYPTKEPVNDITLNDAMQVLGLGEITHYQKEGDNYTIKRKNKGRENSDT